MASQTAQQILDVAQTLVRQRGYSAFSYADIADRVGIRKASIHYHFPSKDELVRALVVRYRQAFQKQRDRIAQATPDPAVQLNQFAALYRVDLSTDQLCLCGMLSADFAVLPPLVQQEIQGFLTENEAWLGQVVTQGCNAQQFHCQTPAATEAKRILATLQGAQLVARTSPKPESTFDQIVQPLIAAL